MSNFIPPLNRTLRMLSNTTTRFHQSLATNSRRSCATSSDSPLPIPEGFTQSVPNSGGPTCDDFPITFFTANYLTASASRWSDITSGIRIMDCSASEDAAAFLYSAFRILHPAFQIIPASSCKVCQLSRRSCLARISVSLGLPSLSKCLEKRPSVRAKRMKS